MRAKMSVHQRNLSGVVLLTMVLLSLATVVSGQSLGELAQRERERRAREPKGAKKVYTNDDFAHVTLAATQDSLPPVQKAEQSGRSAKKEDEAELERMWRRRFAEARARLREAEQRGWQTRIRTVFVGGGGLKGLTRGAAVPVQMQMREFVETEELRQARKAVEELEDELRRAGLPPGWGRE